MTEVYDIVQQIVDDDVAGNWAGGTERGIGFELGDTSFDTWYYDAVRDFLDWYVQGYQANNDIYPPSWVLDVINYEKENYGVVGVVDIDNYVRFHRYINYIKLMEYLFDNEDEEVVSNFKLAMECVFDRIVEDEGEESEEESEEESDEDEVSQVPRVVEVDSDSSDSDDDLDIVKRDTDHIYNDSDSDSDSD